MNRNVDDKLAAWKTGPNRKPLLVRGARQIGKTFSINAFGRRHFGNSVVLDLERNRRLHNVFAGDLDPKTLLPQMEAQVQQRIVPGETLLFLDEIQACPRALMSLRYFHESMPQLHVIAAGSLLEFAMEDISFPVGHVEFLWMHPISFSEFLNASGKEILDEQRPYLNTTTRLPDATHRLLLDELRRYFIVGGMPEAVKVFLEEDSFVETARVHRALAETYQEDFAKYAGRADKDCLSRVFEQMPTRVGEQVKYARLYPEKRVETIKAILRTLERSLVVRRVSSTSAQGLPLGAGASDKVFKCVFVDIGLMRHMCGLSADSLLSESNLLHTFRGSLAEQFVGQELLAEHAGSENGRLYYWSREKRNSSAEVDYLIVHKEKILPVEVKSGPAGKLQSMHVFLREHPDIPCGLVVNVSNVEVLPEQRIKVVPLYVNFRET